MRTIVVSRSLVPLLRRSGLAALFAALAACPAVAGMAELGYKQQLAAPRSVNPDGPAAGNGIVTLTVNGHVFSRATAPGQLASAVLESLEVQINTSGTGLVATHASSSNEITVLAGIAEISDIQMRNTDTALQFVSATRMTATAVASIRAVTDNPAGGSGQVYVRVNNLSARAVTVPTAGKTALQINTDIVNGLVAQGFAASLVGSDIQITGDTMLGQPAQKVYWEDNDAGIRSIGGAAYTAPIGAAAPLMSWWALALIGAGLAILAARFARAARARPAREV